MNFKLSFQFLILNEFQILLTGQVRETAPENLPSTSALQSQPIMDLHLMYSDNLPLNMNVDTIGSM